MATTSDHAIRSLAELRELLGEPGERAVSKETSELTERAISFIAHCPFLVIATSALDGATDASPKGGPPGFVRVLDDHRLAMGELPGNGRVDGYRNLLANPAVGLIFLIPGVGETLRVNGRGFLVTDPAVLDACTLDGRRPALALGVEVVEAFIHCAKALRRASLWDPDHWPDTAEMPTIACMLVRHADIPGDPDGTLTAAALEENYATTLWN